MGRIGLEYRSKRNEALYEAYENVLRTGECSSQAEAIDRARKSEAPNFFTPPRFCSDVMYRMRIGKPYGGIRGEDKRRKFMELYERYKEYREQHPEESSISACTYITEQPAPEFYISYGTAKQFILQERRRRQEETARRWSKRQ